MKLYVVIQINKTVMRPDLWNKDSYSQQEEIFNFELDWQIGRLNYGFGLKNSLYNEDEEDPDIPNIISIANVQLRKGFFVLCSDISLLSEISGKTISDSAFETTGLIGGRLLSQVNFRIWEWVDSERLIDTAPDIIEKLEQKFPNTDVKTLPDLFFQFLLIFRGFTAFAPQYHDEFIKGLCMDGYFAHKSDDTLLLDSECGNLRFANMVNSEGNTVIYIYQAKRNEYNQKDFEVDYIAAVNEIEKAIMNDNMIYNDCIIFMNIAPSLKIPINSTQKLRKVTSCKHLEVIEVI